MPPILARLFQLRNFYFYKLHLFLHTFQLEIYLYSVNRFDRNPQPNFHRQIQLLISYELLLSARNIAGGLTPV